MDSKFIFLLGKKAAEELEEIIKDCEAYNRRMLRIKRHETIRKFRKLIRRRVHGNAKKINKPLQVHNLYNIYE